MAVYVCNQDLEPESDQGEGQGLDYRVKKESMIAKARSMPGPVCLLQIEPLPFDVWGHLKAVSFPGYIYFFARSHCIRPVWFLATLQDLASMCGLPCA